MSYPFETGGETIWDAGYYSGRLYESLACGAAEFLELPSGLTPNDRGGCDVQPAIFRVFVEGLYRHYATTQNPVLHELTCGLLVTSLVMLERAGEEIALTDRDSAALLEEKTRLARAM
ncbi:DUF6086 family protein [Streptomyces sp. NPDC059255]|uniref:DUF6086 family protein n=1 Tax=Streptomyces sp. NPDC059255 TaxID=3346793 RepID=UPI00368AE564